MNRTLTFVLHGCGVAVVFGCGVTALLADNRLTCSSDDGRRNYCDVDTRGGVQLIQQRSDAVCEQDRTWGWDRRGIWVDRGCRADFAVGGYGGRDDRSDRDRGRDDDRDRRRDNGSQQVIQCSSDDGGRNHCDADTSRGVQLIQQRSGSVCEQNRSWGWDDRGVWVDHGCRADFALGGQGRAPDGYRNDRGDRRRAPERAPERAPRQVITCASEDGKRHWCSADDRQGVRLVRQRSGTACTEGQSWGTQPGSVWVDRGCRADFEVVVPR